MIAKINGRVMEKNENVYGEGKEAKTYYSFLLYQKGETELIDVKCTDKQFANIKEGTEVEILVKANAYKDRYGDGANLSARMYTPKTVKKAS